MQTKNFKGQDCRGKSFKNQDLMGADFSGCDLRGVDFSFANLTASKFCNTRMSRTKKSSFALRLFQLLQGVIGGFSAALSNFFIWSGTQEALKAFKINSDINQIIFAVISSGLFAIVLIMANIKQRWDYVAWFGGLIILALVLVTIKIGIGTEALIGTVAVMLTIGLVGALLGVVAGAKEGAAAAAGATAVGGLVAVALTKTGALALVLTTLIYIRAGDYLNRRANSREESQLFLLRNWSLKINCWRGTEFAFANLNQVDFSNTDLKYTRFKNAKFSNCNFKNTKNHHLALFENTPLEPRKVRDLVIDGIITDKNFATLDLRGLDFSNLNLEKFDFSHANLSGANLSHCQLTGAILEGWNIDTETRLDDIDCRYYYYMENGVKKRMPPEGEEYSAGEFTRIFQKIAHTIDFIAHNEMELAAIKLSVEQVQAKKGNEEVRIQGIEEKNGVIVVKVAVPKFKDRGVLYDQISKLKNKIQLLTMQHKEKVLSYETRITDLKEQLYKNRDAVIVTIKDSIINNDGIMNLGAVNGSISQQNTK